MRPTLPELLRHWAAHTPDAPYLTDDQKTLSFAAADAAVEEAALALSGTSGALAIVGRNAVSTVVTLLAAMRIARPCFWVSSEMPEPEARRILEHGGATQVWRDGVLAPADEAPLAARTAWAQSGAALGIVTSGSTGAPRLALRSALSLTLEGDRYVALLQLGPADVILAALPLAHAYGFGAALCPALVAGAHLVLQPNPQPRTIATALARHRVTFLPLVRPLASALALLDSGRRVEGLALRVAMVGAGPCPPELSAAFAAKWGCALSRNYGSSETGALLACVGDDPGAGTGRPMPGVSCEIVNSQAAVCDGQLWVRTEAPPLGHLVAEGWRLPQLAPDGWWPTNDLCRLVGNEGLQVVGRLGQEIRRGGRAIVPAEVAAAIASHAAVEDVLVAGEPDRDGDDKVVARVQLRPGARADRSQLLDHLRARLSAYKHPTEWIFVDALPRTWSGKPVAPAASVAPIAPIAPAAAWDVGARGALLAYRSTELLLAARDVGLIPALAAGATAAELATRLDLDAHALSLVLPLLAEMGLARRDGDRWRALDGLEALDPAMLDLEQQLRRSWLSAEELARVLRHGVAARRFDDAPTAEPLARAYRDVMTGPAARLHARLLVRRLQLPRAPRRMLELGRALGPLAEALRARHLELAVDFVALWPGPPVAAAGLDAATIPVRRWDDLEPPAALYDLIHVTNAVHWLAPERAAGVWARLRSSLRPGGRLLVTDIFQPPPAGPRDRSARDRLLWRLDWLTHGGTHLLTAEETVASLGESVPAPAIHRIEPFDLVTLDLHNGAERGIADHGRNEDEAEDGVGQVAAPRPYARIAAGDQPGR